MVDDIRAKRFQFLQALYNESEQDELKSCNAYEIGVTLGFDENTTDKIIRYFIKEYLITKLAARPNQPKGTIAITHSGICHVEATFKKRAQFFRELKKGNSPHIKAGGNIVAGGDVIVGDKNIKKLDIHAIKKEMWYHTNIFKGAVIALVVALLGGGIPAWLSLGNKIDRNPSRNTSISSEVKTGSDNANTEDETAKATEKKANGIRARMCDIISGEFERLIEKQVDTWFRYNSHGVHLKRFDGKNISMSGVKYNDQSKAVFFSYIEPYIQDVIKRKIEETVELAKDKKVPISKVIGSTKANLSGGIDTTYHKMQEVDRRLRGGGDPKSVPKRDVSFEVKKMNDFLDRQIKTAEDLHFEIHKTGEADKY